MTRLIEWVKGLFAQPCQHSITDARFKWEGEWAYWYEECLSCGEELY